MKLKKIYLIRHCEAEGQPPEAPLTDKGSKQALELIKFFQPIQVDRMISSPYKRAIQSVSPLAEQFNIEIETNDLLTERKLSNQNLPEWFHKLKATFEQFDLKFEGGESSAEAMERIVKVVEEAFQSNAENTIIVTHGNLMSLVLHYYHNDFGFEDWQNLRNPDIFLLQKEGDQVTYKRIWNEKEL